MLGRAAYCCTAVKMLKPSFFTNARTVITNFANLSIDQSVELTADMPFLDFHEKNIQQYTRYDDLLPRPRPLGLLGSTAGFCLFRTSSSKHTMYILTSLKYHLLQFLL